MLSAASSVRVPSGQCAAQRQCRLARPVARRPARRSAPAPPTAVDPAAAAEIAYQVQEFGLALMGVGIVAALASGASHTLRQAGAAFSAATAAAPAAAEAEAPAAQAAPAASAAAAPAGLDSLRQQSAAALEQPQPALELADIKAELQRAAEDAVAAVKSAAEEPTPAPRAKPAPAPRAPGGLTYVPSSLEEAKEQCEKWVAAWRGKGEGPEGEPGSLTFPAADAAAVLDEMTRDAPVGATPVGAAPAPPSLQETLLAAVASAGPAAPAPTDAAAEKEAAYKARLSAVVADSKLADGGATLEKAADKARAKAVTVSGEHLAKVEGMLQGYEKKKAEEAELLAKSERILARMELQAVQEATAAQQQAAAAAQGAAAAQQQAAQAQNPLAALIARIVAFFQALKQWVQQLLSGFSSDGSGSGSAAGASA